MKFTHILMAVAVAVIWGGNLVVMKLALTEWPLFFYLVARTTLTALPLAFFLPRPNLAWTVLIAYGLLIGGKFVFVNLAFKSGMGAGLASILYQTQVFFTMVFAAIFLRERPRMRQNVGMLVAFLGVIFVGFHTCTTEDPMGFVYMLCSAASWGASNLVMKRAGQVNMLHFVVWSSLIPPLPLLGIAGLEGEWGYLFQAFDHMTWVGVGTVLYSAFLSGLLAYTLWGNLLKWYPTSQVVTYSLLVPIFGILWGMVFLGETFSFNALLGGLFVLGGLVLIQGDWERWLRHLEQRYPHFFTHARKRRDETLQFFFGGGD